MKQLLYYFITVFILLFGSCEKDVTNTTDITTSKWKLTSMTLGKDSYVPTNRESLKNNAYVLDFENDSTFWLSTSVNLAGGYFRIPKIGAISVSSYRKFTLALAIVKEEKELNDNLVKLLNEITAYEVICNTLIFKGTNGEIEFLKE